MARSLYEPPDIDVTMAQRQAGASVEAIANFVSPRTAGGSADSTFSFGTRANRPSSGLQGDRYYANDVGTQGGWLYYWTGTAWEIVIGWASGTNAVRAAIVVTSVDDGAYFFATDTGKVWEVSGGAWVDRFVSLDLTTSLKINGTKVIGTRETGWTAGTGTANKGAFATYAGQAVSAGYVQLEAQNTDNATKANSQRIKALEDCLRTHGLMN